ncbi:glycosyltransferase family 2 protein [Leuconostoc gelidum subsp. gasicomitatum]|uniref:glycosyltransferase family A protein n=1 Tax=Leuconostoc gelidum group TaxID=3016637 RepID=UPI001CC344A3|nr:MULTISPECIES: glycosyltransferase family A protein [Leuconostoc gelidum group]MBZ5964360.1 glycosyltransferase family 2 protein [Leuconostoc gelidum subsp. gelidum]MBZ5996181.1 glycosyltransferase family 2 protein [Leuconostoc gasicomitatum]
MHVNKGFFKEFARPNEQSIDTLNFFADFNDMNVDIIEKDKDIEINYEPLVSILMTTYNRQEYVKECIQTIIAQSYKNIEFIIVDDLSTDDTEFEVKNILTKNYIPFKFIKTEGKKGPGLNKRLGWEHIRGEYIIFLDDDDYFVSHNFIIKSIETLLTHPNLSVVAFNSYMELVEKNKLLITPPLHPLNKIIKSEDALHDFMSTLPKPNSTFPAVFNVSKLKNVKISEMKILNDTQIWLRGFLAGDVMFMSDYVGVYRIHNGSIGHNLDITYILDNLDEKIRLYNMKKFPFKENKWIENQIIITLRHYFEKSKYVDYNKINYWLIHNFKIKSAMYIGAKCVKVRIKYSIVKIIKRLYS